MRGKLGIKKIILRICRITPAHAGKTSLCSLGVCRQKDHPRACGENEKRVEELGKVMGSPPRMRGKLNEETNRKFQHGITPAHAGKTAP